MGRSASHTVTKSWFAYENSWLKEFCQCCCNHLRLEKWQQAAVGVYTVSSTLPFVRAGCHISQSHRWKIKHTSFYFLVKLFIISTPTPSLPRSHSFRKAPHYAPSDGHKHWLLNRLSLLPSLPKHNITDHDWLISHDAGLCPGWWAVGGWLSHGAFSLVIYNHPCSHNATAHQSVPPLQILCERLVFFAQKAALRPDPPHRDIPGCSAKCKHRRWDYREKQEGRGRVRRRGNWALLFHHAIVPAFVSLMMRIVQETQTVSDVVDGVETGPEWWWFRLIHRAEWRNVMVWTHTPTHTHSQTHTH